MMTSAEIRQAYLNFFESKGHQIVPSAPIVVKNDPTLMFTNAGMNQFKDLFLGNSEIKYPRIADTQKCLRVSGKHNDLEEVGVDTYHHTMFEMLGNWSFGDYFKKEAIEWAWELLTEVYKIPKDKLYVTVFEGDAKENLAFDQEAYDIWKERIAEDRIIRGNKKDNFWEMGDQGPCGPCTEIHVDLRNEEDRIKIPGKDLVNQSHPQVIEIWNNVFMEFNRKADGSLEKLPAQHVDTGMGFERLCMALQGVQSTYDTDVFKKLIEKIEDLSGAHYRPNEASKRQEILNIAIRVIADHIRAIAFCIADGQLPSNTGAGYVIRRILRRAVRYGYQTLGFKEPFLFRLVPILSHQMGHVFPEINNQKLLVEKVIQEEENSFFRTLENGLKKIDSICIELNKKHEKIVAGKDVFELYDTYGFPIDLTSLIAKGYDLEIDEEGFKAELEIQKERSRAATTIDTDDWIELISMKENVFTGYDSLIEEVKIAKYRRVKSKGKELFQLVFDRTPFYAESGGQVGDKGLIENANETIVIEDTKKENNLFVHFTSKLPENPGSVFYAKVDTETRTNTALNHSATHLLHAALRQVLGTHVEQKGSLVNDNYLRFDFSHFSKVSQEELVQIESIVNQKIRDNIFLDEKRNVPINDAKALGAMALFGEKYGEFVRVITFDRDFSVELCGGTHVKATGQIGFLKITSESAIAAGIRRIEAVTGKNAEQLVNSQIELLENIKELVKGKDLIKSLQQLIDEKNALDKKVETLINEKAQSLKSELKSKIEVVNGVNFIAETINIESAEAIKNLCFQMKNEIDDLFMVLGTKENDKATISLVISEQLANDKKLNAGNIVRELGKEIQGGGGGQAFYATAGGKNPDGLPKALNAARIFLTNLK